MSYTKTNWENLPSTNTPVNASNLNKIENRLEELNDFYPIETNTITPKNGDGFRPIIYYYDINNPITVNGTTYGEDRNVRVEGIGIQSDGGAVYAEFGVVTYATSTIRGKFIYRYQHGSYGTSGQWFSLN